MRWTSVREALPELYLDVLVYDSWAGVTFGAYQGRDEWEVYNCLSEESEITHWMPIPEPPMKENEEVKRNERQ